MCGIAGYKVSNKMDDSILKKMVAALYHRGPDDEGFYSSGSYHAGMRRLTINDLVTGNQPLFNRDRSVVLFYNGEIYNSPQLRASLEERGYPFRTHSDGEVICHLYDECKEGLFAQLDGMFAVALWVEKEKKLILARDIPGEKPLYFSQLSERDLVFASEIRSLTLFPGLDLTLNYQALWDFPTFHWIPEPQTVYESIRALPPAHMLIADDSGIKIKPYITRDFSGHDKEPGFDDEVELIKATRITVEKAVSSRLLSDVPVGSFLSSGLDSSIVATLAARHLDTLDTFTIGFDNLSDPYHGQADESKYTQEYSKKIGTRHHTIRADSGNLLEILGTFCKYGDQPFAVPSGLGILMVSKAARESGIKVLLSGDGADESFGGYSWYRYLNHQGRNAAYINRDERENVSFHNFGMDIDERLKVIHSYAPQKMAWAWHYYASEEEKQGLFSPEPFKLAESSLRFFYNYKSQGAWQPEDFIRQDRLFYLPNEMLRKVDKMTMAFSVEGRVPFVAPAVLSLADKLEYRYLVREGSLKWILRMAFEDILPPEIISRPKHGFNIPVDHWLKGEWGFLIDESFSTESALYRYGLIHKKSAEVARAMMQDKERFNGNTLFAYIILNRWLQESRQ